MEEGVLTKVMLDGDLRTLSQAERAQYYVKLCEAMRLNPLTKPFDYLWLNGRLVLYANKNCAEQLRKALNIGLTLTEKKIEGDLYIVTARAEANGRVDEATGAVTLEGLRGDQRANAIMKAETKAKRRVTLSFAGLGMLDESEIASIPGARVVAEQEIEALGEAKDEPKAESKTGESKSTVSTQQVTDWSQKLSSLPDDVKEGLIWYTAREKLTGAARAEKIKEIYLANQGGPEAIRAWLEESGWKGSADLSSVAEYDYVPRYGVETC